MKALVNRLPKLPARTWLMLAMLFDLLLSNVMTRFAALAMLCVITPCAVALVIVEIVHRRIRWTAYECILAAISAFYTLAAIRNRAVSVSALCTLTFCLAAMMAIGIVPKDMSAADAKRETKALSLLLLAYIVPLATLAMISVFTGRPIPVPGESEFIGIQALGRFGGRIRIFAHPNTTGSICLAAFVLAVFCLCDRPKRWVRALLWFSVAVLTLAIAHCQSRACNIAYGAAVGALAFRFVYLRGFGGKWRALLGLAVWAAALLAVLAAINGLFTLDVGIAKLLDSNARSGHAVSRALEQGAFDVFSNGRDEIWGNGIRYLTAHPADMLLGMGPGDIMERIRPTSTEFMMKVMHLHNSFLETLARGGVPMLLGVLAMLVMLVRPCVTLLTAPAERENPGRHIYVVLIGVLLLLSMVEPYLFSRAREVNLIFFFAAGHVMSATAAGRLKTKRH